MLPIRILPFPPWFWAVLMASLGLLLILERIEPTLAQTSEADEVSGIASPMLTEKQTSDQAPLADLPDGHHQLCSEPDPKDWRDGAGVCLDFSKQERYIQGYYGYPHSSDFVCLQGEMDSPERVRGEGYLLVWGKATVDAIPPEPFVWDREGYLKLDEVGALRQIGEGDFPVYRVLFRDAKLNTDRFYRYPSPRMRSHFDLCEWPFEQSGVAPTVLPSML